MPVASAAQRDKTRWSLLIFAFALTVRGLHLWRLTDSVLFDMRMGDSRVYHLWARQIAGGDWLGSEVFYQAPLYPYFLATIYALLGDELLVVRIVQIILGACSCVFLARAGWGFFSKPAGIVAGLLLAVYAPALFSDAMVQKSVLDIFFICLALWILSAPDLLARPLQCLGLGVVIGALVLSRENALAFVIVLLPWLLLKPPFSRRRRVALAASFLCGAALVLLPVALRNAYVAGEFHLTTSQFGHNFYIGNNPAADGSYAPLLLGRGEPLIERSDAIELAQQALGQSLTPAQISGYYTGLALQYIQSQPGDWIELMARKFVLAFNAVEMVDTEDQYTHAESSLPLRAAGWLFHFGLLAPLAVLGVWITWPARARLLPLYILFLTYTATVLLFYVFWRYRLPMVPFLLLFAAAGLVQSRGFLRARAEGEIAYATIAVAAAALFCNWPVLDRDFMRSVTHYNVGNELVAAGRIEEGMGQYREAIRLRADNARATNNLGALHARQGDLARAMELFEESVRIDPHYAQPHFNSATARFESGDLEGAVVSYLAGLRIDAGRADIYNELGLVYLELSKPDDAIGSFERALSIDPAFEEARENLRRLQARRE